jgi:hypothetical protein
MGFPKVQRAQVDGFLKVYNKGGLLLLFDDVSRQAMVDFANVVLRSYVLELQEQAAAKAKQTQVTENLPPAAATPAAPAKKSGIVITG